MKYYSELTKNFYDSSDECEKAEEKARLALKKAEEEKKAKNEARTAAAKEVENALKAVKEAKKNYNKVLTDFCNTYGTYHCSISEPVSWFDFIDFF